MIDYAEIMSRRIQSIEPSGIRKYFDLLGNMEDVISLTVGQPDFHTPWHIREAAIDSLESGKTYYTSNSGLAELREGIASYLKRRFHLSYESSNVIVTVGGSEAIDVAIRTLINPGDEVIIPQPSFVCYGPIVTMAGGVPVYIETREKDSFKLMADDLRSAITDRTKLLVLPYPNNPTGAVMTESELQDISTVLKNTNIMVLSDEIYAEMTYCGRHVSIAGIDGMKERTIITSGFSKAYAMTGWRLGYLVAPREVTVQMLKLHQYAIMCAPTASQYAAVEAVNNGDADIEEMTAEYNRRRRYIVSGLRDIGIPCFEPDGAFYCYPNVGVFGLSSEEFCNRLLEDQHVAIVPGTAFGKSGEGFARVSYAYSVQHIASALERIDKFVSGLR